MTFGVVPGTFPRFWCQPVQAGLQRRRQLDVATRCEPTATQSAGLRQRSRDEADGADARDRLHGGCDAPVDVAQAVQVDVTTSGWRFAGIVDGKNKIVPSVSLTLKNVSGQTINALQTNAVFRLASTNSRNRRRLPPDLGIRRSAGGRVHREDHAQVVARVHRHRSGRRAAQQLQVQRRQGRGLRQGRIGTMDAPRRVPDRAATHRRLARFRSGVVRTYQVRRVRQA